MTLPTPPDSSGQPFDWQATGLQPAPDPWLAPHLPGARMREPSRTPIYVALFMVAVLSGVALFVSGFTLGLRQSLSPGTASDDQALFDPFWEAYHKISAEYVGSYDPKGLVEGAIGGMFTSLGDPYSSYMTSKEYADSLAGISGVGKHKRDTYGDAVLAVLDGADPVTAAAECVAAQDSA